MDSFKGEINNLEEQKKILIKKFKELEKMKESISEEDYNTQRNKIERALVEIMDHLVQYKHIMKG